MVASARSHPHAPAVGVGAHTLHDYARLAARVARLAATLTGAGLERGERIALVARNGPEYVETLFACWHAGLTAVPVNSKLHASELDYVLEHSGARWAFVDAAWAATLGAGVARTAALSRIVQFGGRDYAELFGDARTEEPAAVASDDPAWLFYTSGTTGRPKGAILSHANLRAMSEAFLANVEPVAAGDAILHAAPLSHGSGLYVVPHVERAAANVVPESGGFDAAEVVALLPAWRNVRMFAAPTMVKRLVAHRALGNARLDRLASIVCGGAPMYVEDCKAAYAALGPRLAQIYGQGESPMTITALSRERIATAIAASDDARLGSVGVAQRGIALRIADDEGAPLPAGEIGEVLVRGPTVMRGYWRNAEASAAALAGGWLHTGDVGCVDGEGFLTLKDRSKDLIISGGSNIYPREVEEVLQRHPGVAEVAVVGRRHVDWGEEVVACVVPRAGADVAVLEADLDALCLEHIARFKRPKVYVFLDELPKNNTGKVLKTALRERLAGSA
ncbi:MAG TPA: AMP-binding protein [Casimicrobiaceae bacterium]|nr:AMP-binding protein [Casimicrobiaceae bacterium]